MFNILRVSLLRMQMAWIGSTQRNSSGLATDFNICWIISRNHTMCYILSGTVCLEIIFHISSNAFIIYSAAVPNNNNNIHTFGSFNIKQSISFQILSVL